MNNILKRDGLTFSHSTDYGAIRLKENIEIYIQTHPQAKVLKDKLLLEFQEPGKEPNIFYTNIVGNKVRTSREINSPSDRINVWVESIVRNIYHSGNTEPITYDTNSWFAEYHHGNFAKIHHHYPFALFSFVYLVLDHLFLVVLFRRQREARKASFYSFPRP